ncbi:MAG: FeoB-associated Cys-rich membrane protein [Desulfobulbaceae bacterium]|nr:FeoB-associated Cys-rich membrane protein [Desulfobulbaceae bacterium]
MWQSLIIITIIGFCLFFIGKKIYRQYKIATDPNGKMTCGGGCSGCSSHSCPPVKHTKKR